MPKMSPPRTSPRESHGILLLPTLTRSILLRRNPPPTPPTITLTRPPQDGGGTGNTALAYHAGRLLALHEGDLPYQLTVLCRCDWGEGLTYCVVCGMVAPPCHERHPFTKPAL